MDYSFQYFSPLRTPAKDITERESSVDSSKTDKKYSKKTLNHKAKTVEQRTVVLSPSRATMDCTDESDVDMFAIPSSIDPQSNPQKARSEPTDSNGNNTTNIAEEACDEFSIPFVTQESHKKKKQKKKRSAEFVPCTETKESDVDDDIFKIVSNLRPLNSPIKQQLPITPSPLQPSNTGRKAWSESKRPRRDSSSGESEFSSPSKKKRRKHISAPLVTTTQVSQQGTENGDDSDGEISQSILACGARGARLGEVSPVQTPRCQPRPKDNSPTRDSDDAEQASSDEVVPPVPLRYKCPDGFSEVQYKVDKHIPCVEDLEGKELWLLRISPEFDVHQLDRQKICMEGTTAINVEETELFTQSSRTKYQYQLHASRDKSLEKSNMCVMMPRRKDSALCYAGKLVGQLSMSQSVVIPPVQEPNPTNYHTGELPKGLKLRYVPFGSAPGNLQDSRGRRDDDKSQQSLEDNVLTQESVICPSSQEEEDGNKAARKKKKKKKHKRKHEEAAEENSAGEIEGPEAAAVEVDGPREALAEVEEHQAQKKKKKHKKHKHKE